MSEISDIKRLLYPLVKGLPWLLIFMFLSVFTAWRLTIYQTPVFETKAVILLDDHTSGFSDNNLYADLDIFSESNNVLTEVEMVKSNVILLSALKRMPTNIEYYRVGKLRTSELYNKTPFTIKIDPIPFKKYNELITIKILDTERIHVVFDADTIKLKFGDSVSRNGYNFTINKETLWELKHERKDIVGDYLFRVNTNDFLLSNFIEGHLFIKEIDKNVDVIQIHFEGENAQRVADFANAVAAAYLADHTTTKMHAAELTETFLNERTNATHDKLIEVENRLESYRLNNRVLNIKQETETNLRKIAQLEVQSVNLKLKLVALDSLEKSIGTDRSKFLQIAPSYESYGGLLFTELVKKIQSLEFERTDLLIKYNKNSTEIRTIDQKIDNLLIYVIENIKSHRKNTAFQMSRINADIKEAKKRMDKLPTTEKDMVMLKREFSTLQDLFNFLKKKQMEAGIAKLAQLHFHRVIEEANVPLYPSRPNKGFNVALAGFLSLLLSVAFIYILEAIKSTINSRHQLEKLTNTKVLGAVKHNAHKTMDGSFTAVISELLPIIKNKPGVSISMNSSVSSEGKTYIAQQTAIALANLGYQVLLIDFNSRNPQWKTLVQENSSELTLEEYIKGNITAKEVIQKSKFMGLSVCGYSDSNKPNRLHLIKKFENRLDLLKQQYEIIIFDNPAYTIVPEAKTFIQQSNYAVFVVRNNFTATKYIKNIDEIVRSLGIEQVGLVINEVPKGVNYSGDFYGSTYMYDRPKGFKAKIRHYWDSYKHAWNIE
jgi:uncharacterized protein involved in exopolysaccharide biosynthesis/Mrp family chromosome partitioning ATPase